MLHLIFLLALGIETPQPPAAGAIPFRTEAAPRVDPVFGDVAGFRVSIDRFLSLQGEMDRIRDEFSSAVNETLVALSASQGAFPVVSAGAGAGAPHACPPATSAPYARALASGGRYLALGQQLQTTYREIRRGDDLGDTLGLTPDYRWKVKKAKDMHQQLLSDYREMRVAFYDQLGTEMRHAGCRVGPNAATAAAPTAPGGAANAADRTNPSDPVAWEIDDSSTDAESSTPAAPPPRAAAPVPAPAARPGPGEAAGSSSPAPAIWIDVDNSLCTQATRLSIDGQPLGEIGGRKRMSVRARSGPHELCALPTSDSRACGDAGTVRKAYLHEGWSLTIHCEK